MKYVAGYAAFGVIYVIQNVIRHPAKMNLENMLVCGIFLLGWPVMTGLELHDFWRSRRPRSTP